MEDTRSLHVVLGAGQIGPRVAAFLASRGHRVRLVRRSPGGPPLPGVERAHGDLTDLSFAAEITRGAQVVYDCMNPAYHRWPEELLPIAGGALHGAKRAGARLVALDCLYMYGIPDGPLREDSPLRPVSKKGELRVRLAELRFRAERSGDLRLAIGRASDFFGTDLPLSGWSDRFYRRILDGKAAECMGDPDLPHAYSYVEDVASGLVTLGERSEVPGSLWLLPTAPAVSTRQLAQRLGQELGLSVRMKRVPKLAVRAAGLFVPFMRELAEMMYQWEVPFVVDDSRFRAAFGQAATPLPTQVAEVAAWARSRYSIGHR